ncbi:MAG TPA: anti-sigma factor RsbA family regulatory protein [Actinopolymorphaceae bacterium]|nr:anti-sigma factor RsbA family regulatory protein [Actinopolymorphaceae bacterium]
MTRSTTNHLAFGGRTSVFSHQAFLYADVEELVAVTTAFVESAAAEQCPVLVAVPEPRLDILRDGLAGLHSAVEFVDMAEAGRNPGRILSSVFTAFADDHPGRRVVVIDEPIWPGRKPAEYAEAVRHEALTNLAFAGVHASIHCAYDVARLPEAAVDAAVRTHPHLGGPYGSRPSPGYSDPADIARSYAAQLPPPPADAATAHFEARDLRMMRRRVAAAARAAGVEQHRVDDLQHAVNEVLTNTVVHTRSPGRISYWQDARTFVCEVRDSGHIRDPLAGRRLPRSDQPTGRGLVLVHHLCDLVQVTSSREGTVVRLHMDRDRDMDSADGRPEAASE